MPDCLKLWDVATKTKLNYKKFHGFSSQANYAERPLLVGEVSANFLRVQGVAWSAQWIPTSIFSVF
jgi:hypothetical protein